MRIEILGDNCRSCKTFTKNVLQATSEAAQEAEVIEIHDPEVFAKYGLLTMPGLVIDGKVKVWGKVLTVEQIKKLLQ